MRDALCSLGDMAAVNVGRKLSSRERPLSASVLLRFAMLWWIAFAFVFAMARPSGAAVINRFRTIAPGASITQTGNTLALSPATNVSDDIGALVTTNTALQAGPAYPYGTTLDWRQDASQAVLNLPPGATILYAELQWGYTSVGVNGVLPNPNPGPAQPVVFTGPLGTQIITPDPATSSDVPDPGAPRRIYSTRSANVTSFVQAAPNGTYTVGAVPAVIDLSDPGTAVGWTLIVAYINPNIATPRDINLFVGSEAVGANQAGPVVNISGFTVAPTGVIHGRIAVAALEGDPNKTGDEFRFRGSPTPVTVLSAANDLSGPNNNINNFFASQVNYGNPPDPGLPPQSGALNPTGTFGTLNSAPGSLQPARRQGWDETNVDATAQLANGDTNAGFQGTTRGDAYVITVVGVQIDVFQPLLNITKVNNGPWTVGQTAPAPTYTIGVTNRGAAPTSIPSTVLDQLPVGITPNVALPPFNGTPINGWTCTVNATNLLTCTHPAGIVDTAPGNFVPITFPIVVGPTANGTLTNYASVGGGGDPTNGGRPPTPGPGCTDTTHCASSTTQILTRQAQALKSVQLTTDADGNGVPTAGDTLTWTVALVNNGTAPLVDPLLTDALPNNTAIVPGSAALVSSSGVAPAPAANGGFNGGSDQNLIAPGTTIAPGGDIVVSFRVTVGAGFAGQVNNSASATATGLTTPVRSGAVDNSTTGIPPGLVPPGSLPQGPNGQPNTGPPIPGPTHATVVIPAAIVLKSVALTTDVVGNGAPAAGDTLTYTATIANTGSAPIPAAQITDTLAPSTTIVAGSATIGPQLGATPAATASTTFTGGGATTSLIGNVVTLAPGGFISVTFRVTIDAGFTGTLANRANGTGRGLPAAVSSRALDGTTTGLPPNVPSPAGSIPQGPGGTPNFGEPINRETLVIVPPESVTVLKSVQLTTDADGNGVPSPGDTLTWRVALANGSTIPVPNAQLTDALPANTSIVAGSATLVSETNTTPPAAANTAFDGAGNRTLLAAPVRLGVGAVVIVTFRTTINAGFAGTLNNTATGTGNGLPPAGTPSSAVDANTTGLPPGVTVPPDSIAQTAVPGPHPPIPGPTRVPVVVPGAALVKSVQLLTDADGNGVPSPGDTIRWTISYANTGRIAIPNSQVTDTQTAGTTIVPRSVRVSAQSGTTPPVLGNAAFDGNANKNLLAATFTAGIGSFITVSYDATINAGFSGLLLDRAIANGSGLPPAGLNSSAVDNATTGLPPGAIVPPGSLPQGLNGQPNAGPPIDGPTRVLVLTANAAGIKSVQLTIDADNNGVLTPGDTLTWTIAYENSGTAPLTNAQITDNLPTNSTIVAGSAKIVSSSPNIAPAPVANAAFNGATSKTLLAGAVTIPVAATIVVSFETTLNAGDTAPAANRAVLNGTGLPPAGIPTNAVDNGTTGIPPSLTVPPKSIPQGPNGTENTGPPLDAPTLATPVVVNAAVLKSVVLSTDADGNGVPSPGDTLTWTTTFANTGSAPIAAAQITDPTLPNLTVVAGSAKFVSATGASPAPTANAAYDGVGNKTLLTAPVTLATGGQITVSFRTTINAGSTGALDNRAFGIGSGLPAAGVPSGAVDNSTIVPPGVVVPPSSIPQGPGGTPNTGPPVNGPTQVVESPSSATGIKSVQLTTDADSNGVLTPGDTLTWTITYVNTATVRLPNSQITDTIDRNTTLVKGSETIVAESGVSPAAAANAGFDGVANKTLLLAPVTIAPSGSITVSFRATLNAGVTSAVTNRAILNGTGLPAAGIPTSAVDNGTTGLPPGVVVPPGSLPQGPNGKPNTGPPLGAPTFAVPQTVSAAGVKSAAITGGPTTTHGGAPGSVVTWTIAYGNTGTGPIANAQITDPLPSNTTFVPGSVSVASATGVTPAPAANAAYNGALSKNLLAAPVTLAPGALIVLHFSVTINPGFSGTITNRAVLTGSGLPPAGIPTGAADNNTTGLPPGFTIPGGSQPQGPNGAPNSGPPIGGPTNVTSVAPALSPLLVEKTVDRPVAASGDRLIYTIVVNNPNAIALGLTTIVDELPGGVAYANGSTRIDGVPVPDPLKAGSTLSWTVPATAPKGEHTVIFAAVIAPGIPVDTVLTNTANANAKIPGTTTTLASGNAQAQTRVIGGIFNNCVTILGRVFTNRDNSGRFGRDDVGIPNVRVYTETGQYVVTDRYGKYNFACIRPGLHVLRLDTTTLPPGTAPYNVRNYDDPRSVIRLAHGVLDSGLIVNVNFAIRGSP